MIKRLKTWTWRFARRYPSELISATLVVIIALGTTGSYLGWWA